MRTAISTVVLMLFIAVVAGQDATTTAKAKADAMLMLRQQQQHKAKASGAPCDCQGHCVCPAGGCACDAAKRAKATAELSLVGIQKSRECVCIEDFGVAYDRAKQQHKPLFLWVGITCTSGGDEQKIRATFPAAVHCHVNDMNGDTTRRLIVVPDVETRDGARFEKASFGVGTIQKIRDTLKPKAASPITYPIYSPASVTFSGRSC